MPVLPHWTCFMAQDWAPWSDCRLSKLETLIISCLFSFFHLSEFVVFVHALIETGSTSCGNGTHVRTRSLTFAAYGGKDLWLVWRCRCVYFKVLRKPHRSWFQLVQPGMRKSSDARQQSLRCCTLPGRSPSLISLMRTSRLQMLAFVCYAAHDRSSRPAAFCNDPCR